MSQSLPRNFQQYSSASHPYESFLPCPRSSFCSPTPLVPSHLFRTCTSVISSFSESICYPILPTISKSLCYLFVFRLVIVSKVMKWFQVLRLMGSGFMPSCLINWIFFLEEERRNQVFNRFLPSFLKREHSSAQVHLP